MLAGAVGSLLFSVGESYLVLTIARALLGAGFAGVLMGAMKAFAAWFPANRFATVSSLFVGAGASGALLAGTPLAWLANEVGWRAIFLGGAGLVTVAALAIVVGTRNAPAGARAAGPNSGKGSQPGAGIEPDAAAQRDGFATIARDHRFWRISFLTFASLGAILAVQGLWGAPYLTTLYGLGDIQVGNALVALGVGVMIGNLVCGWLADQFGRGVVVLTGAAVFLACQVLLAVAPPSLPIGLVYFTFGLFSSYFVALVDEGRSVFPPHLTGRAITGVNFFAMAGAMVVQWLMGVIIQAWSGGVDASMGYRLAFVMTAAMLAVAMVLYVPVVRRR
jgi:predicted MFS family arabinose efflux permease